MSTAEEPELSAESFPHALERVAEGGLLRLIVSKPVQQAIGRLIFGLTEPPIAYLEQWAQGIRSDTIARKQISSAIASAARAAAVKRTDLVDRALDRWTRQIETKQRNRERIGLRVLGILDQDEVPNEAAAPSEDFMQMFEEIAEKISSDDLSDLMARILAGEIRRPGSVSRRTLQVVAILDQEIVSALKEVRLYLLDSVWIHIPPSGREKWLPLLSLLSSVSVTNEAGIRMVRPDELSRCFIRHGNSAILLELKPSFSSGWAIDGANLTPIGRELISTLPLSDEPKTEEIALGFKEHTFVSRIDVGEIPQASSGLPEITFRQIV